MLNIYIASWLFYLVLIMFFADIDDISDIKDCGTYENIFALIMMPAILVLGVIICLYDTISKLIKKLIK